MTPLARLVETSARVGATAGRLAKISAIADTLRSLAPEEIAIAVQYLAGETPQGKFGVGYAALQAVGASPAPDAPQLSVLEVDQRLSQIAAMRGARSAERRTAALGELFARATHQERDFLVRLLMGELRQGALAGVMLDGIAAAARIDAAHVRRAAMYAGNLGDVAHAALTQGVAGLAIFQLQLMSPVEPMLAQTAADVSEALGALGGEAAFEWKIDGARIQLHKRDDQVRIFTRGLNEVTAAVPEIVEAGQALAVREVILDGEAVALTPSGRPHPFQVTMRRFGRKLDVQALRATLPIQAFFFDCLRLDAVSLAERPTHERHTALIRATPESMRVPRLVTTDEAAARAFYEAALAAGHEGVMAKALNAPYEAGNRGASWLKIKRAHTLDLVVLAAEWGHGRRTGKLSNLHLGAFDPDTGQYVMLGKTFKGLTDALLEQQTRELLARQTHADQGTVYVRPELVVEIAFNDLQASTRYPGGLALRLARVKRYRDDKHADDADTMQSVRRIYQLQSGQQQNPSPESEPGVA